MALPVIIASNQTGSPVVLSRLGLTVPASATLELTLYAYPDEIRQDESLEAAIDGGSILLNYGSGDLTKGDSLKFFNVATQEVRASVRLLGETAITGLTGTASPAKDVDGTAVAVGDRVLLTAQASGVENGVWVVQAGAWTRPEDFNTDESSAGAIIFVQAGTTNALQTWNNTNISGSDIIGTSSLTFAQLSGGGGGSVTNLQTAYEGGNTIGATAAEGNIAFTLTSADFTVDGANDMLFGGTTPLAIFNVDTAAMSLDSTDTTNLTMTANDAGAKTLTLAATNAGAGDGLISMSADGTIDIDSGGALSLNSSGGAINIGDDAVAQAINVGTGAAVRTISIGNATGATQIDMDSGTGGTLIDSTGIISLDGVGASNFTTDTGNLTLATTTSGGVLVSSVGVIDAQAAGNVTIDSSGGSINMGTDADTGAINIGTAASARTITMGNTTGATALNLSAGTGNILMTAPLTTMTGNLLVQGTTTTVESEIVNIADQFLYLNDGYTVNSAQEGGFVVNSLPTTNATVVDTGGFTAAVASTTDQTVRVTDASVFTVGSYVQVSGANDQTNDGLYQVTVVNTATTPDTLSLAGIGANSPTYSFVQNDFTTDTTVAGAITEVTVGVVQVDAGGDLQYGYGDNSTTFTFNDVLDTAALTLQAAYVGGNTITTSGGEGVVIVAGTESLQVTATGGLNVDTVFDFDGTSFDVLMTGNNGFSIDGTASSNVSATNTVATTPVVMTLEATNTGATSGDATVDINATSTNGSGIVDIDAEDTVAIDTLAGGNINIGTNAVANDTTIGNNTGATGVTVNSGTEQVEIDGVTYYGSSAGNPTATTSGFQEGDKYFDTGLDMEMRYDGTRAKWLSVESQTYQFGRNGNTASPQYYRSGGGGRVMSSTDGWVMPHNGTIVAMAYTRTDTDSATFDVVEGGTSRATLVSTALSGKSVALDGDFSTDGILAVQNQTGGNTTSNVIGWVKVKFRA
jgi:hypothetical protein